MHKKAAAASQAANIKELHTKISERLTKDLTVVEELMAQTNLPSYAASPPPNALENLRADCEDSEFW